MKKMILTLVLALVAGVAFCQQRQDNTIDTTNKRPVTSVTAFRMHYDDLFKHNADDSVSPVQTLQINGEMLNSAVKIISGETYGGINISAYAGHDMLVDTAKGVVIIRKFLK